MLSEIKKEDIVDLEIYAGGIARTTIGQVKIAKIVQIDDVDVTSEKLSSSDISVLLQCTKADRIVFSSDIEKKSEGAIDVSKSFLRFLSVPDGNIGLEVKPFDSSSQSRGLQVVRVGENVFDLEVGDVIVSCNDIPLAGLSCDAAVHIIKSTQDRRLTVLKRSSVECQYSESSNAPSTTITADDKEDNLVDQSNISSDNSLKDWKEIRKDYLFYQASKRLRSRPVEELESRRDLEDSRPIKPVCTSYCKELCESFHYGNGRIFSETVARIRREMYSN